MRIKATHHQCHLYQESLGYHLDLATRPFQADRLTRSCQEFHPVQVHQEHRPGHQAQVVL
jgi:hypothetical protein